MSHSLYLCSGDDISAVHYGPDSCDLIMRKVVSNFISILFMMTSSNVNIFSRYWPFARSPVNSLHKGQWHGALMFSLICAWINGWVNNPEAGDLRRHHAHRDVTIKFMVIFTTGHVRNINYIQKHCLRPALSKSYLEWWLASWYLTHFGLVMPYGDRDLGQYCLR